MQIIANRQCYHTADERQYNPTMKSFCLPERGCHVLLILMIAVTIIAILVAKAPYLHDFAEWLYQGRILSALWQDPTAVATFYIKPFPVPNSLATVLLASFGSVLPAIWAGKLFLISLLVAWYFVIRMFVDRQLPTQWRFAASLVIYVLAALSTFFWYGYVSYQLGLLLFVWFLAVYQKSTPIWVIALFGILVFFAHAAIFGVFGLLLGVHWLMTRRHAIIVGLIPATVCGAWFVVGRYLSRLPAQAIDASWTSLTETLIYKSGYPAMLGPFKNFLLADGSSLYDTTPWLYWIGFGANFAVALLLGLLVVYVLFRYFARTRTEGFSKHLSAKLVSAKLASAKLELTLAVTSTFLILAYIVAPYGFFGLINLGGRLLIPLVLLALLLGKENSRAIVQLLVLPSMLLGLLTSGSYLYLMNQTRQPEFATVIAITKKPASGQSVFEYNQELYAATSYRYFNYRVFAFSHRFEQIEKQKFTHLAFKTGMLTEQANVR